MFGWGKVGDLLKGLSAGLSGGRLPLLEPGEDPEARDFPFVTNVSV